MSRAARYSSSISSYRPTGELWFLLHILHGLTVAPRTSNPGHPAGIFPPEFGRTDSNINDRFIDQHLFTAHRTAIEIFLRWRAKGFVQPLLWEQLVMLATHTSLAVWLCRKFSFEAI